MNRTELKEYLNAKLSAIQKEHINMLCVAGISKDNRCIALIMPYPLMSDLDLIHTECDIEVHCKANYASDFSLEFIFVEGDDSTSELTKDVDEIVYQTNIDEYININMFNFLTKMNVKIKDKKEKADLQD